MPGTCVVFRPARPAGRGRSHPPRVVGKRFRISLSQRPHAGPTRSDTMTATHPTDTSSPLLPPVGRLHRLGRWCARQAWWVLGTCLLVAVAAIGAARAWGGTYDDDFSLPGTFGQTGSDLLDAHGSKAVCGTASQIVLHTDSGTIDAHQDASRTRPAGAAVDLRPVWAPDAAHRLRPAGGSSCPAVRRAVRCRQDQPGVAGHDAVDGTDLAPCRTSVLQFRHSSRTSVLGVGERREVDAGGYA